MVRRSRLTELSIEKLRPPNTGRLEVFDSIIPALAVRVTANGAKSFVIRTRIKGRPELIRLTIGDATAVGLADARREASDLLRVCRAGDDPRTIRKAKAEDAARHRRNTFEHVAEAFIKQHVSKRRSSDHIASAIRRHLIAHWGSRSIASITADDVAEHIRALIDGGSQHTGRRILAHAKVLFRWAAAPGRSYVKTNPCADLTARTFDIVTAPRQTVIAPDHLRLIWQATDEIGRPFGHFFKMLILSGQRRDEIASMSWSELDLDGDKVLNIPAARMKAKRPHEVPLTPPMIALLADLRKHREEEAKGAFVFSTTAGQRPISGFSKAKLALDARVAKLREKELGEAPKEPIPAWRLHDVRRTVRTALGAFSNVPHDVRELVIAHVPPALVSTYDRHGYREEKRFALSLWAQRLGQIVAPLESGNVVQLSSTTSAHKKKRASATGAKPRLKIR